MNLKAEIKNLFLTLRSWHFLKSVISGGTAAIIDLSLLAVFREVIHLSYWLAINISFAAAIIANFSLQKFWTFSNQDLNLVHKQFLKFFLLAMGNMAMNSFFMYMLSVVFGLWYLGAQVITIGTLAIVNFVLYRSFVFK